MGHSVHLHLDVFETTAAASDFPSQHWLLPLRNMSKIFLLSGDNHGGVTGPELKRIERSLMMPACVCARA